MKKLLMLLALINTSVCFASSEEILPVDNPVESVASASVAPATGTLVTDREFLENDGVVASATGASDLPSHLNRLTVKMTADGFPVNLTWTTPEGGEGSSDLKAYDSYSAIDSQFVFGAGKSGCMFNLNGGSIRRIEELSVSYEIDPSLSVRPWRSVAICVENELESELLVDKIILNGPDTLCICNLNEDNVHINHIIMNSNREANLWLMGKITREGRTLLSGAYTVTSDGQISPATVRNIPSCDFARV